MQLLTQSLETQEERIKKMEDMIESIRNRPPLWMTFSLSVSGSVIGLLVGILINKL